MPDENVSHENVLDATKSDPAVPDATKPCPFCGETILAVAVKCRYCQEYLDPSARPRDLAPSAVDRMLTPVGRPPSAIASGYLGLVSVVPVFGLVTAILALVFGIVALKKINRDPELSGRGRAWFGIIMGTLVLIAHVVLIVVIVIEESRRHGQFR